MRILVVAESPEAFAAWEARELAAPPEPAPGMRARGAKVFREMTCVKCHAIGRADDAPRVGPDLTHLARRTTLGAGVLSNTHAELTRWLTDPQGVKAGCHMPDAQLSDAQVAALVAYFETLQ